MIESLMSTRREMMAQAPRDIEGEPCNHVYALRVAPCHYRTLLGEARSLGIVSISSNELPAVLGMPVHVMDAGGEVDDEDIEPTSEEILMLADYMGMRDELSKAFRALNRRWPWRATRSPDEITREAARQCGLMPWERPDD